MQTLATNYDNLVQLLWEGLGKHLVAVALFGSCARGEAKEDSDVDLLVIADGLLEHPYHRTIWLNRCVAQAALKTTGFVAYTPAEFDADFSSLYLDWGQDAVILYDPTGFLYRRLTRIRALTAEAGLYRVRTADGFAWRWRKPPHRGYVLTWEGYREL